MRRNTQAVFDRYLGDGKPGYVPHEWATLERGGELDHGRGRASRSSRTRAATSWRSERAAARRASRTLGGVGIEVVTGSHTPDQYGYWAKRAREYGLLASVGSDFHGPRESYRDLGDLPPLPSRRAHRCG